MADFSGLVQSFATPGVKLRRFMQQSVDEITGRFNDPSYTDTVLTACLQRPNGRQLQRLPENQRADEVIRIDTATLLRTANPAKNQLADQILYNGEVFEVHVVTDYVQHANYCQALAVKVG
jgi:hypothetical protein